MTVAAWIALFSPAAAVGVIALGGTAHHRRAARAPRRRLDARLVRRLASWCLVELSAGREEERSEVSTLWTWLSAGDLRFGLEVVIDPLSVFMMLVVSGVGFLILTYAIGYMAGDAEERRYHAYKALFVFSMLLLVQGGNLLMLLAGLGHGRASPRTC